MHFLAPSLSAPVAFGLFAAAFAPPRAPRRAPAPRIVATPSARRMGEQPPEDTGADLAAEFFRSVQARNIKVELDDADDADDSDGEDEVDNGVAAGNGDGAGDDGGADASDADDAILREFDVDAAQAGSLSDDQIYGEMKDRVFASAGAFVELTTGGEVVEDGEGGASAAYAPPVNFPDSGLTAGEVVELVLAALRHNDVPRPDYGVEVLFAYSSPESQIVEQAAAGGLTPASYREFLCRSGSEALFEHAAVAIDRADYSPDGTRGYFTARLRRPGGAPREDVSVNFILSTTGTNDDDCWLIDSMLIRPPKLRRRRRR